jgi:hypothetical protein
MKPNIFSLGKPEPPFLECIFLPIANIVQHHTATQIGSRQCTFRHFCTKHNTTPETIVISSFCTPHVCTCIGLHAFWVEEAGPTDRPTGRPYLLLKCAVTKRGGELAAASTRAAHLFQRDQIKPRSRVN